MKLTQLSLIALFTVIAATSCKKTKTTSENPAPVVPDKADVSFRFYNQSGGQDVEMGKMQYTNAANNLYQIDLLKYYVTNIRLVKSDNSEYAIDNYDLINAADSETCKIKALNVPNGEYTRIRFNIGIPQNRNHTGAQDGDLDPALGMIWDWNTGYVFFKHEGKFKNSSNTNQSLIFHFATDRAYCGVEIPLSTPLTVNGSAKKVSFIFDLNKLYANPVAMDFNVDNNHQSSSATDYQWIDNLKTGFNAAFTIYKIE